MFSRNFSGIAAKGGFRPVGFLNLNLPEEIVGSNLNEAAPQALKITVDKRADAFWTKMTLFRTSSK